MLKKRVLIYSAPALASFAKKDIDILNSAFSVKVFLFNPSQKILTPLFFLKQIWFLIKNFQAEVYVSQFGGYHSLLPSLIARIFGRKSYIVTGGTDCVSFPAMAYGNFNKTVLAWFTCASYKLTNSIFPVHETLVYSINKYDPEQEGEQGMLVYCRNLTTPYKVIHNGYDFNDFRQISEKKPRHFITVASGANTPRRFKLKGLDMTCAVAERFPDCTFTIVGCRHFDFNISLPENIRLIGFANQDQLVRLFSEHKYYLQLSVSEGFPNAICEAMLCGCIPIGSEVGAIPDIIGETGLILKNRDIDILEKLIYEALKLPESKGTQARDRIIQEFNIARRKKDLLSEIIKDF